jgi:hypothetical protein
MFNKAQTRWRALAITGRAASWSWLSCLLALVALGPRAIGAETPAAAQFRKEVQPILTEYCYDCHGDGMNKGKVAFDEFKSHEELLAKRDLWLAALKNVRAGLMPPENKPRPSNEQKKTLEKWIKSDVFGIDPNNPDPGRVTIRRLNRVEYRNTIRDLTGFEFKVEDELPPDDSGYGFDNIGDVLTVSPMLLEKYMQAAETIVAGAVPRVGRVIAEKTMAGNSFRVAKDKRNNDRFSFYEQAKVSRPFHAEYAGSYRVALELEVVRQFEFDPGRCRVVFKADDRELWQQEFGGQNGEKFRHEFDQKWQPGEHRLALELYPLTPVEKKTNSLDLRIVAVRVQGPTEKKHWVRPKNFDLFFTKDVPTSPAERHKYAREVLSRFATRAFRRPVDEKLLDRLVAIAENTSREPGKRFEDGLAQAMVPILASPRFLFRVEDTDAATAPEREAPTSHPTAGRKSTTAPYPFLDEYALASRLSYFLWATMPDDELFRLAERKELRKNVPAQLKRMLADSRAQALVENFVGQWLQVRDVEGIDINARAVLARDAGEERDLRRNRQRFQELRDLPDEKLTPEQRAELQQMREQFRRRFGNRPNVELDRDLRRALREETEMAFACVLREDRSVLELIDSDYTFLNERLAKHYGLTNVVGTNFVGSEMRRVQLPKDNPRGGVLTHGSVLIVTSNPTRTSPVKRGLFVLDNILGMPPPPPPPDVPQLEDAEKEFKDRQPTLRETLELHRSKPLCNACHNRMDPLGLALENFNALGMWRDKERGHPIDAAGKLITGETVHDVRDVKRALTTSHRLDFYRCLTEKMLTYALGRGLEYYDVHTVDQIVERLDQENGRISVLMMGIVESAPFQKRRMPSAPGDPKPPKAIEQRTELTIKP